MSAKNKVFSLIQQEQDRQERCINLIASENYANHDVLQATGSVLTNKYAEGYPGRRYYGGCEVVDQVEEYAQQKGKELFKAEHINVQPHSGSSANFAVYMSCLDSGDTILGMSLSSGGHLTHGHKINFSGKLFNVAAYGVSPENEQLDYDEIELLANQHKPKIIIAGASAYSRTIDYQKFQDIAKKNNALLFVDMAHIAGLIAAGLHPNPMPYADFVSSTTHKTLRGPRGGFVCCKGELAQALDRAVMPGSQGGPLMHVIAAKGIAFEQAASSEFAQYQKQVIENAAAMANTFEDLGYRLVAGGTDTHLFLVDLREKFDGKVTGKIVEETLGKCSIVLNRNMIPFDTQSPMDPSGIRIGTPAVTTRGFGQKEVVQIVHWIDQAIAKRDDQDFLKKLKGEVENMCEQFPIYK